MNATQSTTTDHSHCQAALDAMYECAVEIMEDPPELGTQRFWFDSRLGTFGMAYHREGLAELLRERDEAQAEVERLREAIHAHRVARRYNPRAAWVDARLWDTTGEEV